MTDLYRNAASDVSSGFVFDDEVLNAALKRIYSEDFNPMTELEENLFNEFWDKLNEATEKGLGEVFPVINPDDDFLEALRHNNAVFSAFKVHRMQNDMAAKLLDENGELKPFEQWLNDVKPIADHQVRQWFHTEYDTAVKRAHLAAEWKQFEREADVLPNLEWIRSTSITPGADHQVFWGTVRPINDEFWNLHKPGDRWGCKCELRATDKLPTKNFVPDGETEKPAPGLDGNPAKEGIIFSDTHPYNPPSCAACNLPGKKVLSDNPSNRLASFFNVGAKGRKDCYHCSRPAELIKSTERVKSESAKQREKYRKEMAPLLKTKIEKVIRIKNREVKINVGFEKYGNKHLYADTFGRAKNVLGKDDLKNLDSVLSDATFIKRVKLYKKRKHDDIKRFYLFKGEINGKTAYLHIGETVYKRDNGVISKHYFLYSITEKRK
jgi:hypothetical protein